MSEKPLVLDTHVLLWTTNGDSAITPTIRQKIQLALKKSSVLIPTICFWEIGMLWKKERIQLREPVRDWARDVLEKSGFTLAPMTEAIAVESALLPGKFHNDPADCMIAATTRLEKGILLTRDTRMIDYGRAGHLDVLVV